MIETLAYGSVYQRSEECEAENEVGKQAVKKFAAGQGRDERFESHAGHWELRVLKCFANETRFLRQHYSRGVRKT